MSGKNSAFFMPAGVARAIDGSWWTSGTPIDLHLREEGFSVESGGRNR
jgi:hypothetical protein